MMVYTVKGVRFHNTWAVIDMEGSVIDRIAAHTQPATPPAPPSALGVELGGGGSNMSGSKRHEPLCDTCPLMPSPALQRHVGTV